MTKSMNIKEIDALYNPFTWVFFIIIFAGIVFFAFVRAFFQDIHRKKYCKGVTVGKVVDLDWESTVVHHHERKFGFLEEDPAGDTTRITYYLSVEFEGNIYKIYAPAGEAIEKGTEVLVKYNPEHPGEFFLPEYDTIHTVTHGFWALVTGAFLVAMIYVAGKLMFQ